MAQQIQILVEPEDLEAAGLTAVQVGLETLHQHHHHKEIMEGPGTRVETWVVAVVVALEQLELLVEQMAVMVVRVQRPALLEFL
jgi:hypothetical protein